MHVTALGCPQHEADDTRAAEAYFGTLRAISSSSRKPHLNLPLIRAILNGWSSNQQLVIKPDNGDCMRNPQRAQALSNPQRAQALSPERRRRSRYHVAIKLAKRSDSYPRCGPGDNFSDSEAAGCAAGGTSRTWAASGTCTTSGGCSAGSPSPASGRATRRRATRRAASARRAASTESGCS